MILENEKLLANADPILGNSILKVPKPVIESTKDVFHDVMSCILEQQIHYRSTKKIMAKALERANIERITVDNFNQFEEKALSQIKLTSNKYETMLAFLEYWTQNKLNFFQLKDIEVISELSSIKGIGKWTIDMILLYTLERPNIFPYDDFHLKKIMVSLYGLDEKVKLKSQMIAVSENWGNQKSLAVLYLLSLKKQYF
jgi:DNA-3-methyladenine glycosylase II